MNKDISKILIVCVVLEGIITYVNSFFVLCEPHYQMILSLMFGISISIAYKIDLLKLANIKSDVPYVGSILTGILFSRGSNYVHDVLRTLNLL